MSRLRALWRGQLPLVHPPTQKFRMYTKIKDALWFEKLESLLISRAFEPSCQESQIRQKSILTNPTTLLRLDGVLESHKIPTTDARVLLPIVFNERLHRDSQSTASTIIIYLKRARLRCAPFILLGIRRARPY